MDDANNHIEPPTDTEDETSETGQGIHRRTVMIGAAWTIPVIAVAVASPAAAASGTEPTLTFVGGPYAADSCGTLADVTLQLTTDGTLPDPGKPVTVTLPAGLTWSDGTTTPRDFTTDGAGQVVLSGVKAPAKNGNYPITALSGSLTTTGAVVVTGEIDTITNFANNMTPAALPAGVTVLDVQATRLADGTLWTHFLGSDGNVYRSKVASGTTVFSSWMASPAFPGATTIVALDRNGGATSAVTDGTTVKTYGGVTAPALPAGVTITDLQATSDTTNTFWVTAVGSDGNVYRSRIIADGTNVFTPWQVSTAFPGAITIVALNDGSAGSVAVTDGTTVKNFIGDAAPALPAGVTITDLQSTSDTTGKFWVEVLGSDGNTYRTNIVPGSGVFAPWQASPAFPGTTTIIALNDGSAGSAAVSDGLTVKTFGGQATPALPAGVTITDLQSNTDDDGTFWVLALGSDGHSYRTRLIPGSGGFTSWTPGPALPGTTTKIAFTNDGAAGTIVAGVAC
jgi:hypothetical protein